MNISTAKVGISIRALKLREVISWQKILIIRLNTNLFYPLKDFALKKLLSNVLHAASIDF